jgi:hypothetical protein
VDVDGVPDSDDPPCSTAGSEPATAAEAIGAANAATRMAVRRHPLVMAAILSDFVVRMMETAAAINRGRHGNLDRPLIRTLARDLARDLDRTLEYARASQLALWLENVTDMRYTVLSLTLDQARERYLPLTLPRSLETALHLARKLGHAVHETIPRSSSSRNGDLEPAHGLAVGLVSDLGRAHTLLTELNRERDQARERVLDRSLSRTLDLALERARALDRICAQGVAGRLGIPPAEGLAEALLDGAMDDFTSADLTYARPAASGLTGVRWSLSGTTWPPGTDVRALLTRSEEVGPGSGILVVKRQDKRWPPQWWTN